jgi:hypothetical protein
MFCIDKKFVIWMKHFSFKLIRSFDYYFYYLYIYYLLLLSDIPPFEKDQGYPKEFNIIEKRIIEAVEDYCGVFIDKKMEENTDIYQMFFVIIILLN